MKLIIEDDEGRKTVVPLVRDEITIGRQDGNTIRLTERNVSRRHARLVKDNGFVLIEDLGSYNGVRVNGEKISGPTKIKEGDLVEIGDYDLGIQGKLDEKPAATTSPKQTTLPPGAMKAPIVKQATVPPAPAPQPQVAAMAQESVPATPPQAPPPQPATPSASAGGATAIIRVSDIMKAAPQVEARDLQRNEMPSLVGLSGPARGKELIAGATQPGRGMPGQAKAAKAGPPIALIGGIVGGVVVLAVLAFLFLGKGKKQEGGEAGEGVSGAAAVQAGDAAFKKHQYIKA